MTDDMKSLVFKGYDSVADAYLETFGSSEVRHHWFERLVAKLSSGGGRVLDLGSGAGIPVARDLVALGHTVIGVDGSRQQVLRARRNVPEAIFIQADMTEVVFEPGSFDGISAFYSITHLPPAQQEGLIAKISAWLKPDGTFVASFGAGQAGEWAGDWLGTTMFFGHRSKDDTLKSLADVGLAAQTVRVQQQDNEEAAFMWVEATKDR